MFIPKGYIYRIRQRIYIIKENISVARRTSLADRPVKVCIDIHRSLPLPWKPSALCMGETSSSRTTAPLPACLTFTSAAGQAKSVSQPRSGEVTLTETQSHCQFCFSCSRVLLLLQDAICSPFTWGTSVQREEHMGRVWVLWVPRDCFVRGAVL